ncbi:MAG: exo-alpha-sialidase [Ignavibacteriae bacterium]|nr:exo-alpha-sialidase [Ignavibacteriota bacterium]
MKKFDTKLFHHHLRGMFIPLLVLFLVLISSLEAQTPWVKKVSGGGLGNPFCVNPWNDNIIYSAAGGQGLLISRNRGNTWSTLSTVTGGSQIKAVAVSARDTNVILVAMESGPPDKILKSTNNGATWTVTFQQNFYYWGVPLAYLPQLDDDTVYTMGGNTVYRSTDFGSTWDTVRTNPFNTSNQGWEYCVIRPDSPSVLLVADNASGIWKSYDYGVNWKKVHTATGEVPALALSPDEPRTIYGPRWSGGGGFVKSTDGGETWNFSTPLNGINMWGVAVSTTDPNFVITGTYGPSYTSTGGIYISRDAGTTWERTYQGLVATTNYACLVLDTMSLFIVQGDGLWRHDRPLGQLAVTSPNGKEIWHANTVHNITWTANGVNDVKLEYSLNNGFNWITIINSVPAATGSYTWTVPDTVSAECLVRVTDTFNTTLKDASNATFIIDRVALELLSPVGGEDWLAGSTHPIQWSSIGILHVKIQFTTDNGANWLDLVSSMHASVGSYSWKIPHTPSSYCKVKVTNTSELDMVGISDSVFTISDTAQFSASIVIEDGGGNSDTVMFGEKTLATDGLDTLFGESELTIKPPPGTFDARWQVSGTNGTKLDLRDTLSDVHPTVIFTLELQPGSAGYPLTLRWNPELFPLDYFTLRDAQTEGTLLSLDMLAETSCVITNSSITSVQIVHSLLMELPVHANARWNLVSLPVNTNDRSKESVFPTSISQAFEYTNKYHAEDTLEYGRGYWLKFNDDQTVLITGTKRANDSVGVAEGWNIVGSVSKPVPVPSITSDQPGVIQSSFFGYNNGYSEADTIKPGYGYWLKAGQNGKLYMTSPAVQRRRK